MFVRLLKNLDNLLRGEATRPEALREGRIEIPIWELALVVLVLAAVSGLGIGSYSLVRYSFSEDVVVGPALLQAVSSSIKFPLLFFLTLLVTFPSLYVFNALVGSRLTLDSVARLLMGMLAMMMAILCSLIPILVFFSFSTSSYVFIKLLTVLISAVAGILGLWFLIRTLVRLSSSRLRPTEVKQELGDVGPPMPPTTVDSDRRRSSFLIFSVWVIVFTSVGVQTSWLLRPFIGSPNTEFAWFRSRESNFFLDLARSIGELLGV